MLRVALILATGLGVFAISAALSWNLHGSKLGPSRPEPVQAEEQELKSDGTEVDAELLSEETDEHYATAEPEASEPLPVNVRPEYVPGTEEVLQLAADLKKRMEVVQKREADVENKLTQLKIVYQDIKSEQQVIDELKKQVQLELQAVTEQMNKLEEKFVQLQQQAQEKASKIQELEKRMIELDDVQKANIRRMASMYDTMDAESAAKILTKMADEGDLATVAALLSAMKERQAAKVLAALPDPGLAAQLSEHLKLLKQKKSASAR